MPPVNYYYSIVAFVAGLFLGFTLSQKNALLLSTLLTLLVALAYTLYWNSICATFDGTPCQLSINKMLSNLFEIGNSYLLIIVWVVTALPALSGVQIIRFIFKKHSKTY